MAAEVDFSKHRRRSTFEAWLLDKTAGNMHRQHGKRKKAAIGAMRGTIVEIGPGTGVNMAYYADGVKVIAIEPNPVMHGPLQEKADRRGVDLEIRTLRGEGIDVGDASADAVVGTLVLCGVADQEQVLREITRVLKPGGTYFFLEHVGAAHGSRMRKVQQVLNPPHRWVFNGCEVHRDTGEVIRAAGFRELDLEEIVVRKGGLYMPDFVAGTAIR